MGALRQLRARSSSPDLRSSRSRRSAAGDERVRTTRVGASQPPPLSGAHWWTGICLNVHAVAQGPSLGYPVRTCNVLKEELPMAPSFNRCDQLLYLSRGRWRPRVRICRATLTEVSGYDLRCPRMPSQARACRFAANISWFI